MKKLLIILISLFTLTSLNSCVEAQYLADNEVSYSTVVTYGVPYYIDGVISHYIYNNRYYYPYSWNNRWYMRSYNRVMPRGFRYHPNRGQIHNNFRHFDNKPNNHNFSNQRGHSNFRGRH